eukprot:15458412-Alexandrium_andersonii.AAC.1
MRYLLSAFGARGLEARFAAPDFTRRGDGADCPVAAIGRRLGLVAKGSTRNAVGQVTAAGR